MGTLVPRTRSSQTPCRKRGCELRVQRGTRNRVARAWIHKRLGGRLARESAVPPIADKPLHRSETMRCANCVHLDFQASLSTPFRAAPFLGHGYVAVLTA